ncbi:hypothetical protein J7E78_25845 [Paenibacillus polymyxa]|uniref:hypothetical protein n=1 Tax=Paenibacillus polymyxa TaxID=1406 RepID=UPI001BE604D1|nr:hypothetical protein [Paenibacillus polymyxa]MBT2286947.1 hypothetical protein [Paenibacillus polymyxa]
MKLSNYSIDEIRTICRHQLEMFEFWSRRIIDQKFTEKYGKDFINYQVRDGEFLLKKSIRDGVVGRYNSKPGRYSRYVDALLVEDIITILSHPILYKEIFREPLFNAYPDGKDEVRTFLSRLIPIRNNLSHANPISIRNAEQVVCYTNDFIDSLKSYYLKENIGMQYNVPLILKAIDSLGNEVYRNKMNVSGIGVLWDTTKNPMNFLRPGDIYRLEVEIDSSFNASEYTISWKLNHEEQRGFRNKPYYTIDILEKHVSLSLPIECEIKTNKEWHKYNYYDDNLTIKLRVLPPI